MATIQFELVSPEALLISGEVEAVTLPGSEGEFQIMAGHAPLLALLGPGLVTVTGGEGGGRRIFIDGGFCDVNHLGCSVLAEAAVDATEAAPKLDELIKTAETEAQELQGDAGDVAGRRLATLRTVRAAI